MRLQIRLRERRRAHASAAHSRDLQARAHDASQTQSDGACVEARVGGSVARLAHVAKGRRDRRERSKRVDGRACGRCMEVARLNVS